MFHDSAGVAHAPTARLRSPIIAYDALGLIALVVDAIGLGVAVVAVVAVFGHTAYGRPVEAAATAPVAAIPITLFLTALWFHGAYRPDAVLATQGLVRWVMRYWLLALLFFGGVVVLLKSGTALDPGCLAAVAVAVPATFLVQRRLIATIASRAIQSGSLRLPRIFLIAEDDDGRTSAVGTRPRQHFFLMRSFAHPAAALLGELIASIRASDVDEVRLISKTGSLDGCHALLAELRKVHLPVKLIASACHAELLKCPISKMGAEFAFEIQREPLTRVERAMKRGFDILLTLFLLAALTPLMAAAALAIACTSPGPIVFRQTRKGFNGRPFTIYKFRTMTVEENGPDVAQATRNDPRVTPVGGLLRRTSVDELPQLLNVLRGDMSLIGPRPHATAHDDVFATLIASYAARHRVKPGITGWAQVCGLRGETTTAEAIRRRVELDLSYIDTWSFWLDVWITLRTVLALIAPRNAY